MFKRSASTKVGGTRLIDLLVIAAAGLFFVNIVVGSPRNDDDQLLFLAAEVGSPVTQVHASHEPG